MLSLYGAEGLAGPLVELMHFIGSCPAALVEKVLREKEASDSARQSQSRLTLSHPKDHCKD